MRPIAAEAIHRIESLYEIEREIRGKPIELRHEVRQTQARPLVEELHDIGISLQHQKECRGGAVVPFSFPYLRVDGESAPLHAHSLPGRRIRPQHWRGVKTA